jgi:hypothetical protein
MAGIGWVPVVLQAFDQGERSWHPADQLQAWQDLPDGQVPVVKLGPRHEDPVTGLQRIVRPRPISIRVASTTINSPCVGEDVRMIRTSASCASPGTGPAAMVRAQRSVRPSAPTTTASSERIGRRAAASRDDPRMARWADACDDRSVPIRHATHGLAYSDKAAGSLRNRLNKLQLPVFR